MKLLYEAPRAVDLAPDYANQSDINAVLCTNGAHHENGCANGAAFSKPACHAGVSAGNVCISGSQQQF